MPYEKPKNTFSKSILRSFILAGIVGAPAGAWAFSATDVPVSDSSPFGPNCTVEKQLNPTAQTASVAIVVTSTNDIFYAGGSIWDEGDRVAGLSPITREVISQCIEPVTPQTVLQAEFVVDGADGTFASDTLMGFSFSVGLEGFVIFSNTGFTVSGTIGVEPEPPVEGPTIQETQAEIAAFMQSRANQAIASQPDLIGLMSGAPSGAFNLQATQGNGSFELATSGDRDIWARLQGTWSEFDDAEASYTFGVAGAHKAINDNLIVGFMLQFDQSERTEGDAKTEGTGFLVGPYLVTKLPDQPLYFEGRLLVGQTFNEVNVDGNTPEEFDTTRALASAKVAGNLEFGALTVTPSLTATHLSETQEAFTDSADNDIAEQPITMTDIALGLDVAQVFTLEGGALTLSGGVAAVMSSSDGSGFAEGVVSTFDGERGRVHLGARYALESGMILSAGTSFDGLGSDNFDSTSVNVGLQMQF